MLFELEMYAFVAKVGDSSSLGGSLGTFLWVLGGVVAGYERMHCEDQPEGTPGEAQRDTRGNTCNAKPLIKKIFFIESTIKRLLNKYFLTIFIYRI